MTPEADGPVRERRHSKEAVMKQRKEVRRFQITFTVQVEDSKLSDSRTRANQYVEDAVTDTWDSAQKLAKKLGIQDSYGFEVSET